MKGWRFHPQEGFSEVELPPEKVEALDVRIEVEAAVVTARDLELAQTAVGGVPGRAAVGRVVEVGEAASEWLGLRVLVGPYQACGECETCRRALVEHCQAGVILGGNRPGTLRSHIVARGRWICRAESDLSTPLLANIPGPAGLAYSAYCRAGIGPGEALVVVGSGALARLLEQVAYARGAYPIRAALDASLATVQARIATLHDIHQLKSQGVTLFETTDSDKGRALVSGLAKPGDVVVLVGEIGGDEEPALGEGAIFEKTLTLVSVRAAHPDLYPEVLAMAKRTDLDIESTADVLSLNDLALLPDRARRGQTSGRVPVVTFS